MTANTLTCQKCGSPVSPGMKFCESCGAKIGPLPVCPQCGAVLVPDVKFCETCGAPVSPAAPPVSPVPETPPARAADLPVTMEDKIVTAPEEKPVPVPAPVNEPPAPEPIKGLHKETGVRKPVPRQTILIAGVILLALIGAAGYFVVLPMLSGSGTSSQNLQVTPATPYSGSSLGTPVTTADASQAGTVSLTTGPTQVPPAGLGVTVDAERDPITSIITVTFQGGDGQYGVRELAVTLTRSDGTVETKSLGHLERGASITLQGTPKTDRIEVTANYYTGASYKVVDRIFEYKKRNG
jgi:hypothetical protein